LKEGLNTPNRNRVALLQQLPQVSRANAEPGQNLARRVGMLMEKGPPISGRARQVVSDHPPGFMRFETLEL